MNIRNILTPVDFSENADNATVLAAHLAKEFSATLHIAHVYQLPMYVVPDGGFVMSDDLSSKLEGASKEAVRQFIAERQSYGAKMEGHVLCGLPHEAILRIAEEVKADLIVMGTRGRGGISRALLGSVAEKIVRTSSIPVMTVPTKEA